MSVKLWTTDINWIELWTTDINLMYLWDTVIHWIAPVVPSNWLLNNLFAYWKCDDNWTFPDAHWSNDWTISWATYTASWKINGWYTYDWSNDYISIPDQTEFSSTAKTVSAWIKTSATWITQTIINKTDPWNVKYHWYLRVNTNNTVEFRMNQSWNSTAHMAVSSSSTVTDWSWHFVVWAMTNSNNIKIYIDWDLENTSTSVTWVWWTSNYAVSIWWRVNSSHVFNWQIDEDWYWDVQLDDDDVTALYNAWSGLPYSSFTT